jgi:hypothetical protein
LAQETQNILNILQLEETHVIKTSPTKSPKKTFVTPTKNLVGMIKKNISLPQCNLNKSPKANVCNNESISSNEFELAYYKSTILKLRQEIFNLEKKVASLMKERDALAVRSLSGVSAADLDVSIKNCKSVLDFLYLQDSVRIVDNVEAGINVSFLFVFLNEISKHWPTFVWNLSIQVTTMSHLLICHK